MSEKLKSYKDPVVWQKSIALVKLVYQIFCSSTEAQPIQNLIEEVQKMANALRRSLASRP